MVPREPANMWLLQSAAGHGRGSLLLKLDPRSSGWAAVGSDEQNQIIRIIDYGFDFHGRNQMNHSVSVNSLFLHQPCACARASSSDVAVLWPPGYLQPLATPQWEGRDFDCFQGGNNLDWCSAAPSSSAQLAPRESVKRPRQLTLHGSTRRKEMSDTECMDIDHLLVKMISTDFQPLSIVEKEGFVDYCKKLEPRYTLPSHKVLSTKLLPEMYTTVRNHVAKLLSSVHYVAVTTEMWTSDSALSYLIVTVHFVSEFSETSLHSLVLNTVPMTESHRRKRIVTDNGANIKKAIGILKKPHLSRVAHTFNLIVNDAINETDLAPILKKCCALVSHFKSSGTAAEKLRNMQRQMGAMELKLKQDVSTTLMKKDPWTEQILTSGGSRTSGETAATVAEQEAYSVWSFLDDKIAAIKYSSMHILVEVNARFGNGRNRNYSDGAREEAWNTIRNRRKLWDERGKNSGRGANTWNIKKDEKRESRGGKLCLRGKSRNLHAERGKQPLEQKEYGGNSAENKTSTMVEEGLLYLYLDMPQIFGFFDPNFSRLLGIGSGELVSLQDIENIFKKRRHDKEARLETVKTKFWQCLIRKELTLTGAGALGLTPAGILSIDWRRKVHLPINGTLAYSDLWRGSPDSPWEDLSECHDQLLSSTFPLSHSVSHTRLTPTALSMLYNHLVA
ncbi:hypothetical protein PR048_016125 [Dryococelus australis]|uniref:Zinc finger BED domain-containing protein 4 n=1 Tax=Dryococelus australis TaxID=614101 RepID=A0ABQ9HIV6_9NEOP|nr:hypothetical protein PR048_016125 [Dryococelus australis]